MLSVGGDALTLLVLILSGLKAQLVQQVGFHSANLVFFLTLALCFFCLWGSLCFFQTKKEERSSMISPFFFFFFFSPLRFSYLFRKYDFKISNYFNF